MTIETEQYTSVVPGLEDPATHQVLQRSHEGVAEAALVQLFGVAEVYDLVDQLNSWVRKTELWVCVICRSATAGVLLHIYYTT